jgi:phosphate transport system substrate-binding protein
MRIFVSIVTIICFSFVGFVTFFIASFSRDAEFYHIFVPVITVGLITMTILAIYGKLKNRVVSKSMLLFFTLCTLSVIGYESYQAYLKSLEVVSTQDIDLSKYRPFAENTEAVSLDEDSTYKIKDNLPTLDGATALFPVYSAFVQAVYLKKTIHYMIARLFLAKQVVRLIDYLKGMLTLYLWPIHQKNR